ncbi:MAG TPA: hypothetical protein VHG28_11885 [Longimicrobiaceae bacterium]|nr:hypothetical protein [Longimicrobiaceae bacterium]
MDENKGYRADPKKAKDAARLLQEIRTGIVLTGRVVNGKVELDQASVDEVSRRFPDAEVSFVAVNAPFDPQPSAV